MIARRCDEERFHDGHRYMTTVERTCSGRTDCGNTPHPAHSFTSVEEAWCAGLCDCGDTYHRRSPHGPGEHK